MSSSSSSSSKVYPLSSLISYVENTLQYDLPFGSQDPIYQSFSCEMEKLSFQERDDPVKVQQAMLMIDAMVAGTFSRKTGIESQYIYNQTTRCLRDELERRLMEKPTTTIRVNSSGWKVLDPSTQ